MSDTYTKYTEKGQSAIDLAIQEYGTAEAVFLVLEDNPALSLLDNVEPGTQVVFRLNPPVEIVPGQEVMEFMRRNEVRINSQDYV
jgi:hypothetical protein